LAVLDHTTVRISKKYAALAYFTHNKQEKVNCTCFPNSLGASNPVSVFAAMGFDTVNHIAYEPKHLQVFDNAVLISSTHSGRFASKINIKMK